jgi:hypothetical protein
MDLVGLAAELAKTLPHHVPGFLEDVRDLYPALSTCLGGCGCSKTSEPASLEQGRLSNPASCLLSTKPRSDDGDNDDDSGSAGLSAGATCSAGSSEAALQGVPGSNPTGGAPEFTLLFFLSRSFCPYTCLPSNPGKQLFP